MNQPATYRPSSFSVIVIFICLVIIGVSLIPFLNVQLNPSRSSPNLSVSFSWPDASAKVIEQEVTTKLEGLFNSVKGIEEISSVSSRGGGYINLRFKENVNLDAVRFEIASLIRQSYHDLPEQVSYPYLSMAVANQQSEPVLTYTLNAAANTYYIQQYAESQVLPQLTRIEGVNDVRIFGATPYEWEIEFKADVIRNLGIRADDISEAINEYFSHSFLGKGTYTTSTLQEKETPLFLTLHKSDSLMWEQIPIQTTAERIIYLKDVATARFKEQAPDSYYRINGLNTVNIVIYPKKEVNNLKLAKQLKSIVPQISLPAGYSMIMAYDSTEYIDQELSKIGIRTLFSLIMLLVFVWLITWQLRYLLLITVSMVANLLIACLFYYLLHVQIHLYSLAGITISFGIIIDNSIVMIDHLRINKNLKIFRAIFAATLTTIGALVVVFFLEESQRLNLIDFAWVIIINLSVSVAIAWFFIPALMDKIRLVEVKKKRFIQRKRRIVKVSRFYERFLTFSIQWKWVFLIVFLLGFGIPLHWLPDSIEKETLWADAYNKTIGNRWFREELRPVMEKGLGGSLRLFTENVFENSFYTEPERTTLFVRGSMPEGCTVEQLNEALEKMENFISQFDEIELFQTSITGYQNSSIRIQFKPEYELSSFPFFLKSELESEAISLGGLDWSVYGVGQGFSNAIHDGYKSSRIMLEGYNYEQLYQYAEKLKLSLLENPRIKEIEVIGSDGWDVQAQYEFQVDFNNEYLALHEVTPFDFYTHLSNIAYREPVHQVYLNGGMQMVYVKSDDYNKFNIWDFNHSPIEVEEGLYKIANFGKISKEKNASDIYKFNQQYRLILAYDFIGPYQLELKVKEDHVEQVNHILPLGYKASIPVWKGWDKKEESQYYLILLIILIIYFICAILLESLWQPLAIIAMIPVSFIGIFLTFYLFDLNFDQGGFASFVMLAGLVVNAGLFIINDFNNYQVAWPHRQPRKLYVKAFNHKMMPIALTILSTIIGLVPFVWQGQKEVFWFAFAAGVMGGLAFSVVAILVFLPVFILRKKE